MSITDMFVKFVFTVLSDCDALFLSVYRSVCLCVTLGHVMSTRNLFHCRLSIIMTIVEFLYHRLSVYSCIDETVDFSFILIYYSLRATFLT